MEKNRHRYRLQIIVTLFLSTLLVSCITKYDFPGLESLRDVLVVDGIITNDITTIKLTKTIAIDESIRDNPSFVSNATVYVECDDGSQTANAQYSGNGMYLINTGTLSSLKKHRIYISHNGLEYRSDFLAPLVTPAIDAVFPVKEGEGMPVHICVSTHDPENQSAYYRWSFKEHWEINSRYFTNAGENEDGSLFSYDLETANNIYYCWNEYASSNMLLASSDKLSSNIIAQKRIQSHDPSSKKLSVLYYIKVAQNQLHKEAYDYFYNIQKNIDQVGGIFAPMPSNMKGNIRCLSNPNEPIIGYIDVSTTSYLERYIASSEGYYKKPAEECFEVFKVEVPLYPLHVFIISRDDPTFGLIYAPDVCVDCRLFGTKNKPPFWPNNHL